MDIGNFLLAFLVLATFVVLAAGVVFMSIGGRLNEKYANRLMLARVSLQGLVLALIALLFFMGQK